MAPKGMNVDGQICTQRAVDKAGKEFVTGLGYMRSSPLASLNYIFSFSDPPTWFLPSKVSSGHLDFIPEDGAIKVGRHQGDLFQAYTLMKVNNEADGDTKFKVDTNFFPLLHRMIREKTDWGLSVKVTGCATFQVGVLEWTETTLRTYASVLHQANIYGAVAVSRYPYKYSSNVWKAFCELWGPLTNTFHQGNGEMSISLYDLKVIGGLPILGAPYEEFIPPNDDMCKKETYPSTLPELLRIHSHLCKFYGQKHIFWNQWLDHFYRGKIVYAGYGEKNQRISPNEQKIFKARRILLEVTKEGALAAFLVFWLCRFVLPLKGGKVRPETFPMACLMAQGSKVSLAPTVLGYIYRGLGDIVSCPRGPGFTYISMPVHYIVGWLGEHFPYLYRSRPDNDFPKGYPRLARYAGIEPREVNISQARFVFRSNKSVVYRPTVFVGEKGCSLMDNEDLSDDYFEFLVCVRTAKLPVRIGEHLWLEPYFPNRFARQFGFDQGVPTNNLAFGVSSRQNCSVEAMFEAQMVLLKRNTGSLFYVPCSTHQGICTYWYCKWWRTSCVTYLGISLADIYAIFNKRPLNKKTVFSVSVLRDITPGLRKEFLLSEVGIEKSPGLQAVGQSSGLSKNKNTMADQERKVILESSSPGSSLGSSHDVNFKRARYENPDGPGGVDIETVTAADNFTPEIIPGSLSTPSVKVTNQPCRGKSAAYVSNEVATSSLQEVTASIHALFGSEVSNFRQGYIIGEVENIFVKLSSCNLPTEILGCHEEVNLVLDVLVPIINILESGRTELEWFVKTVRHIFACASQISDNAKIIDQGNHIRDLLRRHDECLSTKKAFESELNKSIQELKKIEAEELPVKEAEEIARVLRQQYDSGKHAVKRRNQNFQTYIRNALWKTGFQINIIKNVTIEIGASGGFLLLLSGSLIYWGMQRRKFLKLKEKYFKENGGLLLQQKIASQGGSVETTKIFTAEELEKATNNYHESRILGEGGYGIVYKGILAADNNKAVAIKKSKIGVPTQKEQFVNELLVLSQINHRNVVRLLGCCLELEVPLLVYEFVAHGTLSEHIHGKKRKGSSFSLELRLKIAAETAGALAYLHSSALMQIIHRDVKATNILLDENYIAKVSDFGASRSIPLDQAQLTTLVQGTFGYLDPEYFLTNQLTVKSDVYSFGVVLMELLTSKVALTFDRPEEERNLANFFVCLMKEDRLNQILDDDLLNERNIETIKTVANLAKRCVMVKGEDRPTMKEVSIELEGMRITEKHPWGKAEICSKETECLLGPGNSDAYHVDVRADCGPSTGTTIGYDNMQIQFTPYDDGR